MPSWSRPRWANSAWVRGGRWNFLERAFLAIRCRNENVEKKFQIYDPDFLFFDFVAKINFHPVILAGGRGTRFWPLSRQRRAKQLLALDGKQTMIQQTVARLLPLASPARFWIITNEHL